MTIEREIRHAHFFCGLGGGARGFNRGQARVGSTVARFRCIGGIDVDPASVRDFERLAGVRGTALDLFDAEQYAAFHGRPPPPGWREATIADIHAAFGHERPHIVFLSAPCKGFSGLLAEGASRSAKYQALNALTLRGVWLMLEAWADDPPELIIFENVPRIQTRGRALLDRIGALLRHYGYAVAETTHDCGEIGGLAQSRKRFLLVARHIEKVPPFLYEPPKRSLRGVGEVIGRLPMPGFALADGTLAGGPMHRMPALQWKTWVRLAFVEAGKDWRSLNRLRVEGGMLADYAIAPEGGWRDNACGVSGWDESAPAITSQRSPGQGRFSVADPRSHVAPYEGSLGVKGWAEPSCTIDSRTGPTNSAFSVADPRVDGHHKSVQLGVRPWDEPAGVITGKMFAGGGPNSVADPRLPGNPSFNNVFRIVPWDEASPAVAGPGGPAGGLSVADPRAPDHPSYKVTKYRVTGFEEAAGAVIAGSTSGNGAFAVADPRPAAFLDGKPDYHRGHYGVVDWRGPSGAISAKGCHDNSPLSVADPRAPQSQIATDAPALPEPATRMVAVIRALDGTWHRPFTTLELAALQSLIDPEEQIELDGLSDSAWRERIGNAVPADAAAAVASVMGKTLLLAWAGESFMLSAEPIWVQPIATALAVDVGCAT